MQIKNAMSPKTQSPTWMWLRTLIDTSLTFYRDHQNLLCLSKSLYRVYDKIHGNLLLKCYYMCQMAKHGQGAGKSSCNYMHVHASNGPEKLKCDNCFAGIGIQGF